MKNLVLVPCYKRREYTERCMAALEEAQHYPDTVFHLWDDGSKDGTDEVLKAVRIPRVVHVNETNMGLRNILIDFIEIARAESDVEFLSVVGNDCLMPHQWLNKILEVFGKTDVEILSPNVLPSNAAFVHGMDDTKGLGYRPSRIVGGLWNMRKSLTDGIYFERLNVRGIIAAFNVLSQIITEKNPKVGWLENVTVQDMGHWSGNHELHIKSPEHKEYSAEVGRPVSW